MNEPMFRHDVEDGIARRRFAAPEPAQKPAGEAAPATPLIPALRNAAAGAIRPALEAG